jgi:hypothetical protein
VPSGSLLKQSDGDGDAIGLLVATALPAHDHATIVPFDPGCHRAAVPSWTNPETSRADADGDVTIASAAAPVIAVPADPNIGLRHLEVGNGDQSGKVPLLCYSQARPSSRATSIFFALLWPARATIRAKLMRVERRSAGAAPKKCPGSLGAAPGQDTR